MAWHRFRTVYLYIRIEHWALKRTNDAGVTFSSRKSPLLGKPYPDPIGNLVILGPLPDSAGGYVAWERSRDGGITFTPPVVLSKTHQPGNATLTFSPNGTPYLSIGQPYSSASNW